MKSPTLSLKTTPLATSGLAAALLRRLVLRQLERLQTGSLVLHEGETQHHFGNPSHPLRAEIHLHDSAAWGLIASNGSIGAGESYTHGYWSSPDLTAVVRVFVANLSVLDAMEGGLARFGRPLVHALHWLNRNTRSGSKRNISAHYDLGNELFEQMLDPTLMYSAALFDSPEQSLEDAQRAKLERICRKLDLRAEDHLLEIGSGWGSMALYAARHYGCRVTTTTLSLEQFAYVRQRIEAEGLQERVTVLLKDYRDLDGHYDKLVSIEMIEAVGHRYLPEYFRKCAALLKDDGLMLLQSITIRDQRYAQARRAVDFIQRYIFPGGALPSPTVLLQTATRHTQLNLVHMEDFGTDYARTLHLWHERFLQARSDLLEQGYDESFQRLWEFYLCYCEGGFQERAIGVAQLLWAAPQARRAPWSVNAKVI